MPLDDLSSLSEPAPPSARIPMGLGFLCFLTLSGSLIGIGYHLSNYERLVQAVELSYLRELEILSEHALLQTIAAGVRIVAAIFLLFRHIIGILLYLITCFVVIYMEMEWQLGAEYQLFSIGLSVPMILGYTYYFLRDGYKDKPITQASKSK